MKNIIVANVPEKQTHRSKQLKTMVEAQIYNSKTFGWGAKDCILITNKENYIEDCGIIVHHEPDMNNFCMTGSKLFALKSLIEKTSIDGPFWLHDLDCWQSAPIECPDFLDAGFCFYSRPKINGGSQFWKRSGKDILDEVISEIKKSKSPREEPILDKICKDNERVTVLNSTYNIGCSGYSVRYERAEKPIKVCHLHPYNRIAWQTHTLDRDGLGYFSVSEKLEENLRKFFPDLQKRLDEEGLKRRNQKIILRSVNN